jgi:glycosyltransferase involved in cell wall biosynthesis
MIAISYESEHAESAVAGISPNMKNKVSPILLIVDDVPPAICGVGDYSAKLVKELRERGCNITVLTKRQPNIALDTFGAGAVVRSVIRNWGYGDLLRILREVWAMPSGSIIHIQYDSGSNYNRRSMINMLPAFLRILSPRVRVVVTMHGFHERRRRFRLRATPMLLASHSCIFVTSKDYEVANCFLRIRDRATLVLIASNIPTISSSENDRKLTRKTIGVAETDLIVLFFGDFHEKKGVLQLINAASEARKQVPNLKLVLVGGLDKKKARELHQFAQELESAIEKAKSEGFLVTVHRPEPLRVAQLLRAADLAVFPFLDGASENRGSMLAAIVNETATLTTLGKSSPENFAKDFGVNVVDAGNVDALTERITELLLSPHQLERLREQSSFVARKLSWGAIADRHIEIYQSQSAKCYSYQSAV